MAEAWTPDDLRFALIRAAHLAPPRQVADELLAAAEQPATRLDEVTAFQVRLRAAEVLLAADERGEGVRVLRHAVQEARPDPDPQTQLAAAGVFAEAGDLAEAEALVTQVLGARPGYGLLGSLMEMSLRLASLGHFDLAVRIADEVVARNRRRGGLSVRITLLFETTRENVVDFQRAAQAAGVDLADRQAMGHGIGRRLAEPAEGISSQPPWPALAGSRLLWWPCAEYGRVVRQVPELRDVLGAPWRGHTARVESAMAAMAAEATRTSSGATQPSLAAAQYEKFAAFLERTGADPRLAVVMTAFTEQAEAEYLDATGWPPGRRDRCWCGSKKRYHRCCAA
jgi:hypothetical protein